MSTVYRHTNKTTKVILFCRVLQKFLSTYEAQAEGKIMLALLAQKKTQTSTQRAPPTVWAAKNQNKSFWHVIEEPQSNLFSISLQIISLTLPETTTTEKKRSEKVFQPTCG